MRFDLPSILLVGLALGAAAESPLDQYKAKFQNFLGSFGSYIPSPTSHEDTETPEAKARGKTMDVLTLGNWKQTLYSPVKPAATKPEEWWVLITGRNKTCFGR